jgi:hypothetical protein
MLQSQSSLLKCIARNGIWNADGPHDRIIGSHCMDHALGLCDVVCDVCELWCEFDVLVRRSKVLPY